MSALPNEQARLAGAAPKRSWQFWIVPAIAILGAVASLALAYHWLFPEVPISEEPTAPPVLEALRQAQKQFHEGNDRLAADRLGKILAERAKDFQGLSPKERGYWQQVSLEASLYADLLAVELEEIVKQASQISATASEEEWQAVFRQRYQGKAVLFDLTLHRQVARGYQFVDPLALMSLPKVKARLDIEQLKVLQELDLEQQPRVLFGARLDTVRHEGNMWVVTLAPASGVLLTDKKAATNHCRAWADTDALQVLLDQAAWLASRP